MPDIRGFRGVRFDPEIVGNVAQVVCAPYDVITPEAQPDFLQRSPFNVVRLELSAERPDDSDAGNRYTRAAAQYADWQRQGVVRPDAVSNLYVYDEGFEVNGASFTRRSLLAAVRLADWSEGVVFPHEHTLPKAKADRLRLLTATHTQFSPLLATYDDPGGVATALTEVTAGDKPVTDFRLAPGSVVAAAKSHRVWQITADRVIADLRKALQDTPVYIADGHHRYETALTYRDQQRGRGATATAPSEYVLIGLVEMSDPGLVVLPTHRLVRGLGSIDGGDVARRLTEHFMVSRRPLTSMMSEGAANRNSSSAAATFTFVGLDPGVALDLTLRPNVDLVRALPGIPDELRHVDTLILQRLIFERVLGLSADEAEAGDRIQYSRDSAEAMQAFETGAAQLVFFLRATPLAQIRAAARAGHRMPQKTTYFWPKPVTGVVFFDHDLAWPPLGAEDPELSTV